MKVNGGMEIIMAMGNSISSMVIIMREIGKMDSNKGKEECISKREIDTMGTLKMIKLLGRAQ